MSKEAKPDTWMPLVIGDYLKDTTRLTTEQHGAYLLLIMSYWVEGPPADDDEELAATTRLDARAWKKSRDKLLRFFRIEDGRWRHKRIDEELERWATKKAAYSARAAAGGRAKAAKRGASSSATSTPEAEAKHQKTTENVCLGAAPQPASREVDAPTGQSTLSGRRRADERADGSSPPRAWSGPANVRAAFAADRGEDWTQAYIDPSDWLDTPQPTIIPATGTAGLKIIREARSVLAKLNLNVQEKAA